jgi:predicted PurR-regulated permease PerM
MDGTIEDRSDSKGLFAWTPRRIISATLAVVLVGLGFWALVRFHLVFFSLFEAIVFSTAITPIVDWLQRKGVPKPVGIGVVIITGLSLLGGFIFLFAPLIAEQGANIANILTNYYQDLRLALLNSPSILMHRLARQLPTAILTEIIPPVNGEDVLDRVAQAFSYGGAIARGIFTSIAVVLLTVFWTMDREKTIRTILLVIPTDRREAAREVWNEMEAKVGSYIRGLAVLCVFVGLLALIAYLLIGLPYALLLAIVAGFMEAIPLIGPILGAVPAIIIALVLDPSKVIWVVAASIVIQAVENNLLVPRVMNRAVGVSAVVSLLAFAGFSSLFGLAGALLAIPLAAVIQLLFSRFVMEPGTVSPPQPEGRDYVSMLRYEAQELIQDVRKQVRENPSIADDTSDQVEDAVEAIVNDLDSILARVEGEHEDR